MNIHVIDEIPDDEREPVDVVAEEFADRCRRGEGPSVEEYAARHPEHAEALRRLLPAVAFLERSKSGSRSGVAVEDAGSAPTRLGENRIVGELGRGGMGIVYEAIQEPLGRRVAVKVLHRHALLDPRSRRRFVREAQAVAQLQHPNIVPIYSVGEQQDVPYYVMALVEGTGLDRILEGDPIGVVKSRGEADFWGEGSRSMWVARLGLQAAEALAYAHQQGVLHRDIKPANLLLDYCGTVWLADFGLAKLADDLSLTGTGDLPGTLRYLAPECLHAPGDQRSDVYSLGLTLYELLVGRAAFPESDRARLLRQVQESTPPPPRQLDPTIARDLETIVLKAIMRDPEARYPSADAMAEDLRRFIERRSILARPASRPERASRWIRRNPAVAGLAATTLVMALVAAYFFRLFWMGPPPPRPDGRPWDRPPRAPGDRRPGMFPPPPFARPPFDRRPGPPPPRPGVF